MFWFTLITGLYCVLGQDAPMFLQQQPLLYYTVYVYSMLHIAYIFMPIWIFALVCLCFPVMWLVVRQMGVREETRVRAMGASEELINTFPIFKFKKAAAVQIPMPPLDTPLDPFQANPTTLQSLAKSGQPKVAIGSPNTDKKTKKHKRKFRFFKRDDTIDENPIVGESTSVTIPEFLEIDEDHASCSICLEDYATDDLLKQLPCSHHFHSVCIDDWLRVNAKCPYCVKNLKSAEENVI